MKGIARAITLGHDDAIGSGIGAALSKVQDAGKETSNLTETQFRHFMSDLQSNLNELEKELQEEGGEVVEDPLPEVHGRPTEWRWWWKGFLRARRKVWDVFQRPGNSWIGRIILLVVSITIIVSIVAFLWGSLPEFHRNTPLYLFIIDVICTVIFTVEFTIRFLTTPNYWKFVKGIMNWIDLLSFLPFYIELAIPSGGVFISALAVLRVLRLFRLFKLARRSSNTNVMFTAMKKSTDGLYILAALLVISMILFSSLVFYAEQTISFFHSADETWYYDDHVESTFQSIPHAFWWCVITITTVGYGDSFPKSIPGRLAAAACMLAAMYVVSFPVAILATNFVEEYLKAEKKSLAFAAPVRTAPALKPFAELSDKLAREVEEMRSTAEEMQNEVNRIRENLGLLLLSKDEVGSLGDQ